MFTTSMFERVQFVSRLQKGFQENSTSTLFIAAFALWQFIIFPWVFVCMALFQVGGVNAGNLLLGFWIGLGLTALVFLFFFALYDTLRTNRIIVSVRNSSPQIKRALADSRPLMWQDVDIEAGWPVHTHEQGGTHLRRVH